MRQVGEKLVERIDAFECEGDLPLLRYMILGDDSGAVLAKDRPRRASHDFIEADAEQPGHDLLHGDFFAVVVRSSIGGDRFLALISQRAICVNSKTHGRRKTFALQVSRLAIDNHRDHARVTASDLKRRISSLTYLLLAALGEQMTIKNCDASSAATV